MQGRIAIPNTLDSAAEAAACCAGIIDLGHLDQYTLGDKALQSELLGLFRAQLEAQHAELGDCTNADCWMRAAHTLKGAARAVGAFQVADAAERMEDAGFASADVRAQLLQNLKAVREAFEVELGRLA